MEVKQEAPAAASPAQDPQQLLRQVTMDTTNADATPSNAAANAMIAPPANAPLPEPSPNKSAAAFALSLLCNQQQQQTGAPPATNNTPDAVMSVAAPLAFPPQQPMPHAPTPFSAPPQAWQQYHPFPGAEQSPFPVKRLKVSHAEVTKNYTHHANANNMHLQQYIPSPYYQGVTPYAPKNGMQPPPVYGQPTGPYGPYPSPPTAFPNNNMNNTPAGMASSMVTPTPKKQNYSRKNKSLGLLCENFISTFGKEKETPICIDDAAKALGVERRRIYDIINILESIEIVQRKCKNTYEWVGMEHLVKIFGKFQEDGFREFTQEAVENGLVQHQGTLKPRDPPRVGQKKSLGRLSQQFVQLFLMGTSVMGLTDASDKILGTSSMNELAAMANEPNPKDLQAAATRGLKTKIRRLYDIANVFCSLGLVKKLDGDTRRDKPKFKWAFKLSAQEIRDAHLNPPVETQVAVPTSAVVVASVKTEETVAVAMDSTPVAAAAVKEEAIAPTAETETVDSSTAPEPFPAAVDSSTNTPASAVTQEESVEDASSSKTDEEAGTLMCEDKKIMANINAVGAAEPLSSREETDIIRTVSASTDI